MSRPIGVVGRSHIGVRAAFVQPSIDRIETAFRRIRL